MTKQIEVKCKNCAHWAARLDKNGRRTVRSDDYRPCRAPIPDLPTLPKSIPVRTDKEFWRSGLHWPPRMDTMKPNDGEGCPLFKPR